MTFSLRHWVLSGKLNDPFGSLIFLDILCPCAVRCLINLPGAYNKKWRAYKAKFKSMKYIAHSASRWLPLLLQELFHALFTTFSMLCKSSWSISRGLQIWPKSVVWAGLRARGSLWSLWTWGWGAGPERGDKNFQERWRRQRQEDEAGQGQAPARAWWEPETPVPPWRGAALNGHDDAPQYIHVHWQPPFPAWNGSPRKAWYLKTHTRFFQAFWFPVPFHVSNMQKLSLHAIRPEEQSIVDSQQTNSKPNFRTFFVMLWASQIR